MKVLEAATFLRPTPPFDRLFPAKLPRHPQRRFVPIRAKRGVDGGDLYGGDRPVDEGMIVLRMRIRELKLSEMSHVLPSDWMEWEKKYYENYNEDVCEAMGWLQSVLMNTRPSLAMGMVALVALSVPFSSFVVLRHAIEVAKEKEGGIVKKGHELGLIMAISLLEEHGLPLGLLPLADVVEVGFVKDTGYMWIIQKKKVEHNFKMISKLVSYNSEITGNVEKKRIEKLKGVKAKELMLWPPVNEITVDDLPTGKMHFKRHHQKFSRGGVCCWAVMGVP
ncbi:unnamed protein product [Camellia sinensis]